MGFMPGVKRNLANDGNSLLRMVDPDIWVGHTIAGRMPAKQAHWSVRWDGYVEQHRDDDFQSAACFYGNPRCWTTEFEDTGPKFKWIDGRVPAMTDEQLETGVDILVYLHREKDLPLIKCPNSLVTSRGVGYHRQGIDGNFDYPAFKYPGRVSGGEKWSTSFGKICPDDIRITQILTEMLPEARKRVGLDKKDVELTDRLPAVTWADGRKSQPTVADILHGLAAQIAGNGGGSPLTSHGVGSYVSRILKVDDLEQDLKVVKDNVAILLNRETGPKPPVPVDLSTDQLDYIVDKLFDKLGGLKFVAE